MREPGNLVPRPFFLPGTFCEKMKSAWNGAEEKDTFLPGTFCDKMKSAWKGAEVKDTFWLGTFMKRKVVCISVPTKRHLHVFS